MLELLEPASQRMVFKKSVHGVARSPGATLLGFALLSCSCLVGLHFGAFRGTRVLPYDAVTDYYPWFINALNSARSGLFVALNPYKLGGMVNFHLLACYDPFYWLPLLMGWTPTIHGHQVLNLLHLFLVPCSLLAVAALHGARGIQLLGVAALGVVAALVGPALIYQQHLNAVDSYCWGFAALASFEWYLERGEKGGAWLAAAAVSFAFARFATGAVFWPLFFVPYALLSRTRIVRQSDWTRTLVLAAVLCAALLAPYLVESLHLFRSLTASAELEVNNTLAPSEAFALLGMPLGDSLSIIAIPTALWLASILAATRLSRPFQVFYLVFSAVCFIYAFGQLTPFCDFLRKVYPPAAFFRRPYAVAYISFPVLFFLVAQQWTRLFRPLKQWLWVPLLVLSLGGGVAYALRYREHWKTSLVLAALTAVALWQARRWQWMTAVVVLQWVILCWRPFLHSHWYEHRATEGLNPFSEFQTLYGYLPRPSEDSHQLYRVVSIGLPATFGAYSSVFEYYNLAPDFSTLFPRELVRESHIQRLHAAEIAGEFRAHPELIGSSQLREMGVRFYFFTPEEFPKLNPAMHLETGPLHRLPVQSYWTVIEDSGFRPFVHVHRGKEIAEVSAEVKRDRVSFIVPPQSESIDLGFIYDDWWQLTSDSPDATARLVDHNGQLRLEPGSLSGKRVSLHYGARAFSVAVLLQLMALGSLAMLLVHACCKVRNPLESSSSSWDSSHCK